MDVVSLYYSSWPTLVFKHSRTPLIRTLLIRIAETELAQCQQVAVDYFAQTAITMH